MNTLNLTINLLTKKYDCVNKLLEDLAKNEEHALFIFAKDFAKEILSKNTSWNWVIDKVDDLNSLVVKQMQNFVKNYYLNVLFVTKKNGLTTALETNNVAAAVKWLMERYVNLLKNLFDSKSKDYIKIDNINFFYFNSLANGEELISSSLI